METLSNMLQEFSVGCKDSKENWNITLHIFTIYIYYAVLP